MNGSPGQWVEHTLNQLWAEHRQHRPWNDAGPATEENDMTATEPVQRIDLTNPGDSLTYVEILTPAGIVRVNTNLVNWRTDQPVVVVEIEPNNSYRPKTAPGGDWDVAVGDVGTRTDVTLTRRADT